MIENYNSESPNDSKPPKSIISLREQILAKLDEEMMGYHDYRSNCRCINCKVYETTFQYSAMMLSAYLENIWRTCLIEVAKGIRKVRAA